MTFPKDIRIVDTHLGLPTMENRFDRYAYFKRILRDKPNLTDFEMPARYMFKNIPTIADFRGFEGWTVDQMDKFSIQRVLVGYRNNSFLKRRGDAFRIAFFRSPLRSKQRN
jgi:hypothetical protein